MTGKGDRVVIFGAGRAADTVYRYLTRDSEHEICGFVVQEKYLQEREFHGLPVVAFESIGQAFPAAQFKLFVALGFQNMNRARAEIYLDAKRRGYSFISYIHSSVKGVEAPQIGENCLILERQSISLDVKIGNNVTLWSGNHIGDRTVIGDHVWLTSHVCIGGDARIGPYCFLGMNSTVAHNVNVAANSFIGANALIAKDTETNGVYIVAGTPRAPLPTDKFLRIAKSLDMHD